MLFPRKIQENLIEELCNNKVLILMGSRQVGKSSLLKILQSKVKNNQQESIFLDLDFELNLEHLDSLENLLLYLREQGFDPDKKQKKLFLFVDEFQYAPKSPKVFKNIYDHYPNIKIIASGSSSLDIKQLLPESMAGRKQIYHIHPLDFEEFLVFKQENALLENKQNLNELSTQKYQKLKNLFEEYTLYGGYPAVCLDSSPKEKIKTLGEIYNSYIKKDIRGYMNVENVIAYNKLVQLLAINTGQILKLSNLASDIGIDARTVEKYIQVLEDTFIINPLQSFHHFNLSKELIKSPKIYFCDSGLRNFALQNFNPINERIDSGDLLETAIISEAHKNKTLLEKHFFWRTLNDTEVDLIRVKNNEVMAIEIKQSSKPKKNDIRSLLKFNSDFKLKNHNLQEPILISSGKNENLKEVKQYYWWDYSRITKTGTNYV